MPSISAQPSGMFVIVLVVIGMVFLAVVGTIVMRIVRAPKGEDGRRIYPPRTGLRTWSGAMVPPGFPGSFMPPPGATQPIVPDPGSSLPPQPPQCG